MRWWLPIFPAFTLNNFPVSFPSAGNWYVHLNSDSTNYGPDYGNIGSSMVTASGFPASGGVTIGPYSALILSPTPDVPPQLTLTLTNGTVNISWPSFYSEWVLYQNSALTENSGWFLVPPAQYPTDASTISVNVTPSGENNFYRLQKR